MSLLSPLKRGYPVNAVQLETQFCAELQRLAGVPVAHVGLCAIAVSGGPDSMALLGLANAIPDLKIIAATVDHQLRDESRDEAAMVAEFCAKQQIDHRILRPEKPITGNVQSNARHCRYALLHQWAHDRGANWMLTAHHADDQLETMIMRLNRGSGVAGMAAIRAHHKANDICNSIAVMRPLLPFTKKQLVEYVAAYNMPFVADPSNDDRAFDRVKVRQALASCDWLDPVAANRAAQALDNANTALRWAADHFAQSHLQRTAGHAQINPADLPDEILLRLVYLALQHLRPDYQPRGSALHRIMLTLQSGKKTTQGDVSCFNSAGNWCFEAAPPRNCQ